MRLKIDVYYNGKSDVEFMIEGLSSFIKQLTDDVNESQESKTLLFPLGTIMITNEANPVDPNECECEDDLSI